MWFSSWLRHRTVSRKHRPANRFRPTLEVLEDRCVPATFTVNTTADVLGHSNGMLSLRQAVIDANASPGADTIVLPAGHYTLTRAGINEDAAVTGDLDITGTLNIKGAAVGSTVVDAHGLDRVFHVLRGADVSLSGLTIEGGAVSDLDVSVGGIGIMGIALGGGAVSQLRRLCSFFRHFLSFGRLNPHLRLLDPLQDTGIRLVPNATQTQHTQIQDTLSSRFLPTHATQL